MSIDELIIDEPLKISKKELDDVYEAYKTIDHFCYRVQEISLYHLDEKANRYARDLQSQLKLHLKLLLKAILNETYCDNDALEVLKKKEVDA